jgi:CMP-N-acetylneuraminic acid synthetase
MSPKQECIAIIPARGGSKGVPRKNIRPLGGKPLIAWSIEQALASGVVDRVVVSTEDEEIAEVSRQWGADVPFLRPMELAGDTSIVGEAVSWTLDRLSREQGVLPNRRLILYPTHPFRTLPMFREAVAALDGGSQCVHTVRVIHDSAERYAVMRGGRLRQIAPRLPGAKPGAYSRLYGLINGSRSPETGGPTTLLPVTDAVNLMDIDTYEDFELAELILAHGLYDPQGSCDRGGSVGSGNL